jgi:uncharacterized protein involved in response to NO
MGDTSSAGMGLFDRPLWQSGFRPFFLLSACYGPVLLWYWLAAITGLIQVDSSVLLPSWHQHEMIFGFAFAIIAGFITTALPSWARTIETQGLPLAIIVLCWCLGRLAFWNQSVLPQQWVMFFDQLLIPVMIIFLLPKLLKAPQRRYLALIPILLGFWFGNHFYYLGEINTDLATRDFGLKLGLYSMIFLYHIVAGTLTPIFTETALQQAGGKVTYSFNALIEMLTVISLLFLIVCDLSGYNDQLTSVVALATCLIHFWRMSRWHGLSALRFPLVWTLQLAYLLLIISFALNAMYHAGWIESSSVWVHAFTVGALALKQLSILTRVALKHTGRPLQVNGLMKVGFVMVVVAVVIRLATTLLNLSVDWLLLSGIFWSLPFLIWLGLYGRWMWLPSLPK